MLKIESLAKSWSLKDIEIVTLCDNRSLKIGDRTLENCIFAVSAFTAELSARRLWGAFHLLSCGLSNNSNKLIEGFKCSSVVCVSRKLFSLHQEWLLSQGLHSVPSRPYGYFFIENQHHDTMIKISGSDLHLTLGRPAWRNTAWTAPEWCTRPTGRPWWAGTESPAWQRTSSRHWTGCCREAPGRKRDGSIVHLKPCSKQHCQLEPPRSAFSTWMGLGIVWPPNWIELDRVRLNLIKLKFSPNSSHVFHVWPSSANSPSRFVIVR